MGFTQTVLDCIETRKTSQVTEPNFDTWRFPLGRPKPVSPEISRSAIEAMRQDAGRYDQAAALFEDAGSLDLLRDLLAFRALGPQRVKLATNRPAYWAAYSKAQAWRQAGDTGKSFPPYPVERFRGRFAGETIELDCWLGNIVFSYILRQYEFTRPQTIEIKVAPGDYVIDAGVCFGDTALGFAAGAGAAGRVFGFEPSRAQAEIARENIAANPGLAGRIGLCERAMSDVSDQVVRFAARGAAARVDPEGDVEVRTISIDDFVKAEGLRKVDFIKMDIEGGEGPALDGAARTIADFRPVLAISAYHRPTDLFELPMQIRRLHPGYRLFLDHYTIHREETVVFAVPA